MIDIREHGGPFGGAKDLFGIFDPASDAPFKEFKLALHLLDISPYIMVGESPNYMILGTPQSNYNSSYDIYSCTGLRLHDRKTGAFIRSFPGASDSVYGYGISCCIVDEGLDRLFVIVYKNYPGQSPQFDTIIRAFKLSDGTRIGTDVLMSANSGPSGAMITPDVNKKFLIVSAGSLMKFFNPITMALIHTKNFTYQPCSILGCDSKHVYHLKSTGGAATPSSTRYDDSSFTETAVTGTWTGNNIMSHKLDEVAGKIYVLMDKVIVAIDTIAKTHSTFMTFGTNVNTAGSTIPWNRNFLTAGYLHSETSGAAWKVGDSLAKATTDATTKTIGLSTTANHGWGRLYTHNEFSPGYYPTDETICRNLVLGLSGSLPTVIKRVLIKKY